MKLCILIFAGLFAVMSAGCDSNPVTLQEGRFETPEKDLSLQAMDLQRFVDDAPDGGVVVIPLGRYELAEPLRLTGRRNLRLAFEPGTQLRGLDTNAAVVAITDSQGVTVTGLRARHEKPLASYNCHGPVISVQDSRDVRIENCELNGCGAIGVSAVRSTLSIVNCHVHHNTFNAFYFSSCQEVTVVGNLVEHNANTFQAYRCGEILWSDNLIRDNGGYWQPACQPGIRIHPEAASSPAEARVQPDFPAR
ncbi:MAG: right-handed parallel beta-helix repeat-containing protein [Phycisphaerae bacterium]|nr:right-handed parallel beta-helix repeat-containing protein [Phycisphaerae bacterium]